MSANGDARTASPDRATMMVAMVALLLSGVATYAEFIHNPTSFTANVRGLRIGHVEDTTLVDVQIYLLNAGARDVLLLCAYPFLSADGTLPDGSWQDSPSDRLWWGDRLEEPILVEPGDIQPLTLTVPFDEQGMQAFRSATGPGGAEELQIGVRLNAMNVKGRSVSAETFVGTVGFTSLGEGIRPQRVRIKLF